MVMKKSNNRNLKSLKNINKVRQIDGFSLYPFSVGDVSDKRKFTDKDLEGIQLLTDQEVINASLFDYSLEESLGNEYALMDSGVLRNVLTGEDLGIYNYGAITSQVDKDDIFDTKYEGEIDECCMLAEDDPLMGTETEIIHTIRGYLEVCLPSSEFSIIRKNVFDSKDENCVVFIPQGYVKKYQLRNGDEIVCSYIKDNDKFLLDSLFTINGVYYKEWECNRPFIYELSAEHKPDLIPAEGRYLGVVAKKYGLYQGDGVFVYINKNTLKATVANNLIQELAQLCDKVVYINPQARPSDCIDEGYNIAKFCISASESSRNQRLIALLGANYAKRMVELGHSVMLIVDDINNILALDEKFDGEIPTCKTILSTALATNHGSATSFALSPLRFDTIKENPLQNILGCFEDLGIVIDNGEVDLYNSYRA